MKKFIRYLRLKPQSPSDRDEHAKRRRRYEADFTLEPFAGLTPEYMEMSAWAAGAGAPGGGALGRRGGVGGALGPGAPVPGRAQPAALHTAGTQ